MEKLISITKLVYTRKMKKNWHKCCFESIDHRKKFYTIILNEHCQQLLLRRSTALLLSLLLTEVMKIARLTSPPLDVPRQSLPRPRLRHGRRPALLFHLNLILNLCTLFFALLLALLPRLLPLLTFLTVLLPGNRLRFMPLT